MRRQVKLFFGGIALVAFSYNVSYSQIVTEPYTPFMLHNAKWTFESGYGDLGQGGSVDYWTYYWTTSDTTISSLTYTTLYYKQDAIYIPDQGTTGYIHGAPTLIGYLRQDTLAEKVFFLALDSTQDTVIYNFNKNVGDTLFLDSSLFAQTIDTAYIFSVDSFQSGGTYYPRLNIMTSIDAEGHSWIQSAWIEGFGSTQDFFFMLPFFNPYGIQIGSGQLYCFSANGVTIYPSYANDTCAYIPVGIKDIAESKPGIYPNPASDIFTLQWNGSGNILSASLFDATGRLVQPLFNNQTLSSFSFNIKNLASGLYLVNVSDSEGKTTVLKLVKQ